MKKIEKKAAFDALPLHKQIAKKKREEANSRGKAIDQNAINAEVDRIKRANGNAFFKT